MTRGCRLVAVCLTAPVWNLVAGCQADDRDGEQAGPLTVPIAELPLNRRVRFVHDGKAVELMRTAEGVTARSLLCTNQGCEVRWVEADRIYLCPCHDGRFDDTGQPIYGPPREPLRPLDVTLTATAAVVDG